MPSLCKPAGADPVACFYPLPTGKQDTPSSHQPTFSKPRPTVSALPPPPPRVVLENRTFLSCAVVQGVFGQPRGLEVPGQMAPVDSLAETAGQEGGVSCRTCQPGTCQANGSRASTNRG